METICANYIFSLKCFVIANITFQGMTFKNYRKEIFYDSRWINKPLNWLNPFTYLSNTGINLLFLLIFVSNILLYNGIYYRVNILLQYLFYYCFMNYTRIRISACNLLNYSSFIFLISPYFYKDPLESVPGYGLFFLNYKLAHLYLNNGISKLFSRSWRQGYSIKLILCSLYSNLNFVIPTFVSEILAYSTLVWEIAGWSLLFFKETKFIGIGIGASFHLGMLLTMSPLWTFQIVSLYMLSTFLYFDHCWWYWLNPFTIIQIINDCFHHYSTTKQILYHFYGPIIDFLNINEYKKYEMFHDYFNIRSYDASVCVYTDKSMIEYPISNDSLKNWNFGQIIRCNADKNFQKTIIKKFSHPSVVKITFKEIVNYANADKVYNMNMGLLDQDILDKHEKEYEIFISD